MKKSWKQFVQERKARALSEQLDKLNHWIALLSKNIQDCEEYQTNCSNLGENRFCELENQIEDDNYNIDCFKNLIWKMTNGILLSSEDVEFMDDFEWNEEEYWENKVGNDSYPSDYKVSSLDNINDWNKFAPNSVKALA